MRLSLYPFHPNCGKLVRCDTCTGIDLMRAPERFKLAVRVAVAEKVYPSAKVILELLGRKVPGKGASGGAYFSGREAKWRTEELTRLGWRRSPDRKPGAPYGWVEPGIVAVNNVPMPELLERALGAGLAEDLWKAIGTGERKPEHGEDCAADRSPDCDPPPGPCNCRLSRDPDVRR